MFSAPCFRPTAVIIWLHSLPPWYLAAAVEVPDTFQHADPSNGYMLCSLPSPCPLYTFLSVPQTRSENFFPHFLHFLTLLCTMNHVHLKACLFTGTPGEEQKAGLPYRHLYHSCWNKNIDKPHYFPLNMTGRTFLIQTSRKFCKQRFFSRVLQWGFIAVVSLLIF